MERHAPRFGPGEIGAESEVEKKKLKKKHDVLSPAQIMVVSRSAKRRNGYDDDDEWPRGPELERAHTLD